MLDHLRRLPVVVRMLAVMAAAFIVMMALAVATGLASHGDEFWGYIRAEAKWRGAMIAVSVPVIYLAIYLFGRPTGGH